MQKFEIVLKNEKIKSYRLTTLLIVVMHILFFIFFLFDDKLWKKGIAGLVLTAIYILYKLIVAKTSDQKFYIGQGFFFIIVVLYPIVWLMILDSILGILCIVVMQPFVLEFNSSQIRKKFFPQKKYDWLQFENVILKDSILTLDFKNNKLLQAAVENTNVNEPDFNEFAKQQLNKIP